MSALPHEASHGRGERRGFRMDKCARAIALAIFIPILGVDLGAESIARPSVQNSLSWDRIPARLIGSTSLPSSLRACDSGEFFVEPFESHVGDSWDVHFPPDLALQESGEVYVGPFGREDRSEWDRAAGCPGSPSSQVNAQPREQASGRALGKNDDVKKG